jgi:hypothetical protein
MVFWLSKVFGVSGAVFFGIGGAQDGYRHGKHDAIFEGKTELKAIQCGIRKAIWWGFNGAVAGGAAGAVLFAPLVL